MQSRTKYGTAVMTMMALLVGTLGAVIVGASPAGAASSSTPNVCWWSVPGDWYNQPVSLTGEATPETTAANGSITLSGTSLSSELPDWVGVTGANLGVLHEGSNPLSIKGSLALQGTNTTQGVQLVETTSTANVVLTRDATTGALSSAATPLTFNFPNSTWTANGNGAVDFKQAAAGQYPGTNPAINGAVKGSAVFVVSLGGLNLSLDCQAGRELENAPFYEGGTPTTFETVALGTGPVDPQPTTGDHECISGLGRYKQQEVQTISLSLTRDPVALAPTPATSSVSLNNAKVAVKVPADFILAGYRDSHGIFGLGNNSLKTQLWVAIAATNTVEGVQTVAVETNYTTDVVDPTPADKNSGDEVAQAVEFTATLPASSWTPTGAGTIEFTEAPAGSLAPIGVIGTGYQETPYKVYPYGSIFVRAETNRYGANLDCLRGDVTVKTGTGVPAASNFGNLPPAPAGAPAVVPSNPDRGSRGRYDIVPAAAAAPFATGSVSTEAENAGEKGEIVTLNVVGSPLQLSVAGRLVTLSTVKLNGTDQTTNGALKAATVVDPRGTSSGWNLVGVASVFNGTASTIPSANLGWAPTSATATPGAAVTGGLNTAQTLCSSAAGSAGGTFTCGGSLSLLVPSSTPIGTYTSTLSLTLI